MFELLSSTGFGSCLMLFIGIVGVPAAIWWNKRQARRNPKAGV
jgi:hypothetical protein